MSRLAIPLLAGLIAACAAAPCPEPESRPPEPPPAADSLAGLFVDESDDSGSVNLNFLGAGLLDVLRALSIATGLTIVVDPAAQVVVECGRLTVFSPRPVRPSVAFSEIRIALRGAGMEFERAGDRTVVLHIADIERARVVCSRPAPEDANKTQPLPLSRPERPSDLEMQAVLDGITEVSPTERNITSAAYSKLVGNTSLLMKSARILPYERDGKVQGFKLYGIRRNSLFGRLGLRNGDIVNKINNIELISPETALEAYESVTKVRGASLVITRRGAPTEMHIRILDAP